MGIVSRFIEDFITSNAYYTKEKNVINHSVHEQDFII